MGGGGSGTVTESNTMQYLGLTEQRTNEIKQLYATLKEEDDDEDEIMPPRGNASSQLQIKLPSTVEDYDEDEAWYLEETGEERSPSWKVSSASLGFGELVKMPVCICNFMHAACLV